MDVAPPSSSSAGETGGPTPFLLKTYNMVDDSSTNDNVSWSSTNTRFVVWNPPEFTRLLIPTYFKHNKFSSFIWQLNTYVLQLLKGEETIIEPKQNSAAPKSLLLEALPQIS